MDTAKLTIESLPPAARSQVERVLSGDLQIAPEYSNLSDAAALYLLVVRGRMTESEARFKLAIARGRIDGDLVEVTA